MLCSNEGTQERTLINSPLRGHINQPYEVTTMRHSTFYTRKGARLVYTTKSLTDHHRFLATEFDGRTFEHDEDACLFFVPGFPLDEPIGKHVKEVIHAE